MKKKIASLLLTIALLLSLGMPVAAAADKGVVILYTNDVHCAVDDAIGYAGLAAYKADMAAEYGAAKVTLVDAGDAVQGSALGTLSKGEYLVEIMNKVGYDVLTLGNHEFDYGMAQMQKLMGLQKAQVVSCNFMDLTKNTTVYKPYTIIDYGTTKVAYVGITTPKAFTSSTPKYFQDSSGKYIYGLSEDDTGKTLYAAVQASVDAAKAAGADTVIAVGHCGVGAEYTPWQSTDIIANTTGIKAFIDGHSHSTIKGDLYKNKNGETVLLTSSGTKLAAIGKLMISASGQVTSDLVTGYTKKDESVDATVKSIQAQNKQLLGKVVATTTVPLIIKDQATATRLIRNSETNLGDLCADAYRTVLGADIAVVNGGGIRADIPAGDITYNNIINVHPFGNMACVVEASGQEILDLLEMMARLAPAENGGFEQVSGLTYEINTYIKSSVVLDSKGSFVKVDGPYRVQNVLVGGVPLQLDRTYTLASHNYLIKNGGDGYSKFADNKLLQDEVMLDNQVLITYIVDYLNGNVGESYANVTGQTRIIVNVTPFTDVASGSWYQKPVSDLYTKGLLSGTTATTFSPETEISRAAFLTMLYREAGSPAVSGKAAALFSDCADGTWYSAAVVWAAGNNMIAEPNGGAFNPTASLTRAELAVFLYKYIQSQGGGFTGAWMYLVDYADREAIPDDAYEAVCYCTQNGLMSGFSGSFLPQENATRAMAAVVVERYDELQSTLNKAAS